MPPSALTAAIHLRQKPAPVRSSAPNAGQSHLLGQNSAQIVELPLHLRWSNAQTVVLNLLLEPSFVRTAENNCEVTECIVKNAEARYLMMRSFVLSAVSNSRANLEIQMEAPNLL